MITILIVLSTILAFVCLWRRFFFSFIGWLYLARVSVGGLLVLFGLPLLALGPGRALCIGAFDLHLSAGSFCVGLLLPLAAWATFLAGALVLAYGASRSNFKMSPPPQWTLGLGRFALGGAILLNVWTIYGATSPQDAKSVIGRMVAGLALGLATIWSMEELHRRCSGTWLGGNLYLLPHTGEKVRVEAVMMHQHAPHADDGWGWLLRGYREKNEQGKWQLMPGHQLSFNAGLFSLFVNIVIFIARFNSEGELTAMVYLLVLQISAVLVLGGLSFFLDAYRIPFLTILAGWLVLAGQMNQADHFYRIWPRIGGVATQEQVATPARVLADAGRAGRPIVLVAIAGGGIQSAAWSARVLTGLEEVTVEAKDVPEFHGALPDFAGSVQCLSGVSGGSAGAMFFAAGYGEYGLPAPRPNPPATPEMDPGILDGIVAAAEASSLGQAVWGLTYPDARRAWLPFFIRHYFRDRAEKMEIKWAYNAAQNMGFLGEQLKVRSLAEWQKDVLEGRRPAIIFNGTMVESGERISFSTAPLRDPYLGQREFVSAGTRENAPTDTQLYPGADLRITTAARLSAGFPVVSPAARPCLAADRDAINGSLNPVGDAAQMVPGEDGLQHVVDGGYYENTGLGALVQWLDNGLTELARTKTRYWPRSILIIQLDGFPTPSAESPTEPPAPQSAADRGTIFQIASPLDALYNVRGAGHTASAQNAFNMLQKRWLLSGPQPVNPAYESAGPQPVCDIEIVRFTIPVLAASGSAKRQWWQPGWIGAESDSPPLSWHLRECEKQGVEMGWEAFRAEAKSVPVPTGFKIPAKFPSAGKDKGDPGAWPVDAVLHFLHTAPRAISLGSKGGNGG
jgi:hypothetical protein